MKKAFMMLTTFVVTIVMSVSVCFAAPEYVGLYESSGSAGMLSVTNPNKSYTTTYSKACSVSGFASVGAKVYVYCYDASSGFYKLRYENSSPLYSTAGASGMFILPVKLSSGSNSLLIRAEKDGAYQNVTVHVNVLSASMFSIKSSLKGFKLN